MRINIFKELGTYYELILSSTNEREFLNYVKSYINLIENEKVFKKFINFLKNKKPEVYEIYLYLKICSDLKYLVGRDFWILTQHSINDLISINKNHLKLIHSYLKIFLEQDSKIPKYKLDRIKKWSEKLKDNFILNKFIKELINKEWLILDDVKEIWPDLEEDFEGKLNEERLKQRIKEVNKRLKQVGAKCKERIYEGYKTFHLIVE